jgi:hypothetical protein
MVERYLGKDPTGVADRLRLKLNAATSVHAGTSRE